MPAIKVLNVKPFPFVHKAVSQRHIDGWENLLTGMGRSDHDKRVNTTFSAKAFMTELELTDLYVDDGIGKRIVDIVPDDMMRKGFDIDGDPDCLVQSKLEEIGAFKEITRLLKWNRLFGGALCVMGVNDGNADLKTPLNKNNIRELSFLRVYDRFRIQWTSTDLYSDPRLPKYNQPEFYTVYPIGSNPGKGLSSFLVHESRCIVMDGVDIPDQARLMNQGWGASYLQHCYEVMRSCGNVYGGLENIIDDFIYGVLTIQNLQEMMAAGKEKDVKDRLELMDLSRHMINTLLLDEREKYEKHASTVSGLAEIVDKFFQLLVLVTGIPMRKLIGQQTGGLNNKGEGETDDYNNMVASDQERDLKPIIERLTKIIILSKQGPFKGIEPKDWKVKFRPLTQLSEETQATIRKTNADADCAYVNASVLDPEEVAESRFGGESYGDKIILSKGPRNIEPVEPETPEAKPKGAKYVKP
jgi:uncharacterized protein